MKTSKVMKRAGAIVVTAFAVMFLAKVEASVDLENVQWNEITATAVDSAADADGIYWFIPAPKTGDANVYRFFKTAE